jgi:hypothetical protein
MSRAALPELLSPEAVVAQFAQAGIAISERELRRRARKLRACREIGKALFFTPADVERIVAAAIPEVPECPSSENEDQSGTTLSPSPESAFEEARKRLTGNSRKMLPSSTKRGSVVPLSTVRRQN